MNEVFINAVSIDSTVVIVIVFQSERFIRELARKQTRPSEIHFTNAIWNSDVVFMKYDYYVTTITQVE